MPRRSVTLVLAYLMTAAGMRLDKAMALVKWVACGVLGCDV